MMMYFSIIALCDDKYIFNKVVFYQKNNRNLFVHPLYTYNYKYL